MSATDEERWRAVLLLAEKLYVSKFAGVDDHEARAKLAFEAATAFYKVRDAKSPAPAKPSCGAAFVRAPARKF